MRKVRVAKKTGGSCCKQVQSAAELRKLKERIRDFREQIQRCNSGRNEGYAHTVQLAEKVASAAATAKKLTVPIGMRMTTSNSSTRYAMLKG